MNQAVHISNNQHKIPQVYKPTHKIQYSIRATYILPNQQRYCLQTAPHQELGTSLQFLIENIAPQLKFKQLFLLYNGIQVSKHMNYYDLSLDRSFQNYQIKIADQKPLKKQKGRLKYTTSFKKQKQIDKCNIRKLTSEEKSDLIASQKHYRSKIDSVIQQRQTKIQEKLHVQKVQADDANVSDLKKKYEYLMSEKSSLTQIENFIVYIQNLEIKKVPEDEIKKLKQKAENMRAQDNKGLFLKQFFTNKILNEGPIKVEKDLMKQNIKFNNNIDKQVKINYSITIVSEEDEVLVDTITTEQCPELRLSTLQKLAENYGFEHLLNQYSINQQNQGKIDLFTTIQDMAVMLDTHNLKFIAKKKLKQRLESITQNKKDKQVETIYSIIIVSEEDKVLVETITTQQYPELRLSTLQKLAETYGLENLLNQYNINQQSIGEISLSLTIQDMAAMFDTHYLKFIAKKKLKQRVDSIAQDKKDKQVETIYSIIIVSEEDKVLVETITTQQYPELRLSTLQKLAETYGFENLLNQYNINQQSIGEISLSLTIQDMAAMFDTHNLKFIAIKKH